MKPPMSRLFLLVDSMGGGPDDGPPLNFPRLLIFQILYTIQLRPDTYLLHCNLEYPKYIELLFMLLKFNLIY